MARDITIDELNTYLYCGEYYRRYQETEYPVYDPRSPSEIMCMALMKWLVSFKASRGILPSEEEVLVKVAMARRRLELHGHHIVFASQINDIHLLVLGFRSFLNTIDFSQALMADRYVRSGMSVLLQYYLIADNTLYIPSSLPFRHILNSPHLLLPAINRPELDIEILWLRNNSLEHRPIDKNALDFAAADRYYTGVLSAMASELYMPVLNCTKAGCPNYNTCYISKIHG